MDKRRSAHNVSEVMNLIGDVRGKVAVLVDDMIDTAGTISNAAKVLRAEGAREVCAGLAGCRGALPAAAGIHPCPARPQVYACASHAVFSPPAVDRLGSGVFEEVIVTNTIPVALVSTLTQLCAEQSLLVRGTPDASCCSTGQRVP